MRNIQIHSTEKLHQHEQIISDTKKKFGTKEKIKALSLKKN